MTQPSTDDTLVLAERWPADPAAAALALPLTAQQRTGLRGRRRTACGRELLLQLPRGAALEPGERLGPSGGAALVRVEAAAEPLLQVRSPEPLALLQAAYHLGNRHVALELHADRLLLLEDSVLAELLRQRGLQLTALEGPFCPEPGAYDGHSHSFSQSHSHAP